MKRKEYKVGELSPNEGFNAFKVYLVSDNLSHLMGEILTVVDASTEGEKNKAMKDLIKRAFSEKQSWFSELSWKYEVDETSGQNIRNDWENGLVAIDNSIGYAFES